MEPFMELSRSERRRAGACERTRENHGPAALVVSAATVKTHINHIFQKTGARDRAQAVRYAYQHGLA
jgi:hypothetical protein